MQTLPPDCEISKNPRKQHCPPDRVEKLGVPQRSPDGTVQLSVLDFTGRTTVVEVATELFPANWQPIWTNTLSSGSFTVIDRGGSGSPRRFYRALAR